MKTTGYVVVLSLSFLAFTSGIAKSDHPLSTQSINVIKKINLNTVSTDQLVHTIRGIGPKRAQAIIAYREKHGRFKSITQIAEVKGIGQAFVAQHLNDLKNIFTLE